MTDWGLTYDAGNRGDSRLVLDSLVNAGTQRRWVEQSRFL